MPFGFLFLFGGGVSLRDPPWAPLESTNARVLCRYGGVNTPHLPPPHPVISNTGYYGQVLSPRQRSFAFRLAAFFQDVNANWFPGSTLGVHEQSYHQGAGQFRAVVLITLCIMMMCFTEIQIMNIFQVSR